MQCLTPMTQFFLLHVLGVQRQYMHSELPLARFPGTDVGVRRMRKQLLHRRVEESSAPTWCYRQEHSYPIMSYTMIQGSWSTTPKETYSLPHA